MTRNTTDRRSSFSARLTHIMQIQTQYGRLWLRSRFRRMSVPPALKLVTFVVFSLLILALTGTMLLMFDLIAMVFRTLKRPFPRGGFRQPPLIRKAL
ncbi:hypothetical protein ASE99_10645 [Serratia sp. Leaf51]|nr:hypothetical protein ASE99_10645 [Serratia sp. Leaf51]